MWDRKTRDAVTAAYAHDYSSQDAPRTGDFDAPAENVQLSHPHLSQLVLIHLEHGLRSLLLRPLNV